MPLETILEQEKTRCQIKGTIGTQKGIFQSLSGKEFTGYEIHMGKTRYRDGTECKETMISDEKAQVYGSYVHGIFDQGSIAAEVVEALAIKKGITLEDLEFSDYQQFKETQYDKLADTLRIYLDMEAIYGMLREAKLED